MQVRVTKWAVFQPQGIFHFLFCGGMVSDGFTYGTVSHGAWAYVMLRSREER